MDFIKKYGLDEHSHPADWFTALVPLTPCANLESIDDIDVKGDGRTKFAVSNWTSYTRTKAAITNAGEKGDIFEGKYKRNEPLTSDDIRKIIGTYIIGGICPSPQLKQKNATAEPRSNARQ